jgi:4-diphosphocytidyl-2C-methyl-D-erythritol kinase
MTLERLRSEGALGSAVSGSGPTCFGLFDDRSAADAAGASIRGAFVSQLR